MAAIASIAGFIEAEPIKTFEPALAKPVTCQGVIENMGLDLGGYAGIMQTQMVTNNPDPGDYTITVSSEPFGVLCAARTERWPPSSN